MNISRLLTTTAALAGIGTFGWPVLGHNSVQVGHNAAGALKAHWHQGGPVGLAITGTPGTTGWADVEVGVEAVLKDEPREDLFSIPDTTSIQFIVVSSDPEMVVWNDSGSAVVPIGGSYTLGPPYFHHHPLWNITSGVYGESYEIQIKFHDSTGTYTDSEPVTILFAPACPGDVNLSATVDVDDLLGVINGWGECPDFCQDDCPADFDETCEVDVDDLLTVINGWGDCNQ